MGSLGSRRAIADREPGDDRVSPSQWPNVPVIATPGATSMGPRRATHGPARWEAGSRGLTDSDLASTTAIDAYRRGGQPLGTPVTHAGRGTSGCASLRTREFPTACEWCLESSARGTFDFLP